MVEAIDGQHFSFSFRVELLVLYWETDINGGLVPTVLCLEGVGSVLKVVVQLYILHVRVEILQLFPLKFGVLRHLR